MDVKKLLLQFPCQLQNDFTRMDMSFATNLLGQNITAPSIKRLNHLMSVKEDHKSCHMITDKAVNLSYSIITENVNYTK